MESTQAFSKDYEMNNVRTKLPHCIKLIDL